MSELASIPIDRVPAYETDCLLVPLAGGAWVTQGLRDRNSGADWYLMAWEDGFAVTRGNETADVPRGERLSLEEGDVIRHREGETVFRRSWAEGALQSDL